MKSAMLSAVMKKPADVAPLRRLWRSLWRTPCGIAGLRRVCAATRRPQLRCEWNPMGHAWMRSDTIVQAACKHLSGCSSQEC